MSININDILNGSIEKNRLNFLLDYNIDDVINLITRLANNNSDIKSSFIIIGLSEDGKLDGINPFKVDKYIAEINAYSKYIVPAYLPLVKHYELNQRSVLMIWCPIGRNELYSCPKSVLEFDSKRRVSIAKLLKEDNVEAFNLDVKNYLTEDELNQKNDNPINIVDYQSNQDFINLDHIIADDIIEDLTDLDNIMEDETINQLIAEDFAIIDEITEDFVEDIITNTDHLVEMNPYRSLSDQVEEVVEPQVKIPFDTNIDYNISINDIRIPLIYEYLQKINIDNIERYYSMSIVDLLKELSLVDDNLKPYNASVLFFNEDASKFFNNYKIVFRKHLDNEILTTNIKGPLYQQILSAFTFLNNELIQVKELDSNYHFNVIKAILVNSIIHSDYEASIPLILDIYPDNIKLTIKPGFDNTIDNDELIELNYTTNNLVNPIILDYLNKLGINDLDLQDQLKDYKQQNLPVLQYYINKEDSTLVITMPINPSFIIDNPKKAKRRTKEELMDDILLCLSFDDKSAITIYHDLGYSGATSLSFRNAINLLIEENKIVYSDPENTKSKNSTLRLVDKEN